MKRADIPYQRLQNQHLLGTPFKNVVEAVRTLGAVQSQDFAGAKWALGMRVGKSTDAQIEKAYDEGKILRTHLLRPTWHFVLPEDIRWMLALTAPHIQARMSYYDKKLGLNAELYLRSDEVIRAAVKGGNFRTREELKDALQEAGIGTEKEDAVQRFAHIVMHAELQGIICSGPMRGKQFTYALLDERVPKAKAMSKNEALKELTKRFFKGHGPATVNDFRKWSDLNAADAKEGIELARASLRHELIEGQTYWYSSSQAPARKSQSCFLLPNYDEFFSGYSDYSVISDPAYAKKMDIAFAHSIVINGQVVGAWKRTEEKKKVVVTPKFFRTLTGVEKKALEKAAAEYGKFLGVPVSMAKH